MVENFEALLAGVGIISAIGGAGGAWGASRTRIAQAEKQITEVKGDLKAHDQRTQLFGERLARMETLLEQIDRRLSDPRD